MADRDRYMADAIVTVMPIDPLSFSLEYNYGRDRYDESFFGLQLSKFQTATVDVDLRLAKWVSVNAFYTYEYNSQSQEDRQLLTGRGGRPRYRGRRQPQQLEPSHKVEYPNCSRPGTDMETWCRTSST